MPGPERVVWGRDRGCFPGWSCRNIDIARYEALKERAERLRRSSINERIKLRGGGRGGDEAGDRRCEKGQNTPTTK
jgi:hypothetical protein